MFRAGWAAVTVPLVSVVSPCLPCPLSAVSLLHAVPCQRCRPVSRVPCVSGAVPPVSLVTPVSRVPCVSGAVSPVSVVPCPLCQW